MGWHYLSRLRNASQTMGELIDNMLILSRVTRHEIQHQTVDMGVIAKQIIDNLARRDANRQVKSIIHDELVVKGDAHLLKIMLDNLLENAWKYSSKTPEPKIVLGDLVQAGRVVYFVRDNGAGFDMTYVNKLFGAFQRLHRDEDFSGTGVGLATVKRIIHRHGGEVWAEGCMGEGAVFFFTLNEPLHHGTG